MERIVNNLVVVGTPVILDDHQAFDGQEPSAIQFNVFHNPHIHVRQYAQVKTVPRVLQKEILAEAIKYHGKPIYDHAYGPEVFYYQNDSEINILPGDIVYFHYNMLKPSPSIDTDKMEMFNHRYYKSVDTERPYYKTVEKEHLFKLPFNQIFLIARYEKTEAKMLDFHVSMPLQKVFENPELGDLLTSLDGKNTYRRKYISVGGWCMVRPDLESWEDIMLPTYVKDRDGELIKDAVGNPIENPKDEWIVTKASPGEKYLQGYLDIVGDALDGDAHNFKRGDHVFLKTYADNRIIVDGVGYYRVFYQNIIAKSDKKYKPVSDEDRKPLMFSDENGHITF